MAKTTKKLAKKVATGIRRAVAPNPDPDASLLAAFAALDGCGDLLRKRLAEIDPLEHPARWAATNDELRGIEERLFALRGEHQRVAMARAELRTLSDEELAALYAATSRLATLVQAAERVAALAEAAGTLLSATGAAIEKLRR